jgi:hypothetical protein
MMSLESFIDETIKKAIERGEFDDLKGKGKPLDLTTYFNTPEDLRMAYSLLRSNEFRPEEVDIMKEIGQLREEISVSKSAEEKSALTKTLHKKQLALTLMMEKYKRKR